MKLTHEDLDIVVDTLSFIVARTLPEAPGGFVSHKEAEALGFTPATSKNPKGYMIREFRSPFRTGVPVIRVWVSAADRVLFEALEDLKTRFESEDLIFPPAPQKLLTGGE